MLSPTLSIWIGIPLGALAAAAVIYQWVMLDSFGYWFSRPRAHGAGGEAVTLLKPLHGLEPQLAENLATFLAQDHAGPMQMLCGVNAPDDAALEVAEALAAAHPQAAITLWPGPRKPGANGKIGNLAAMMASARHPVLVLSDSDIAVAPDYLDQVLGALAQPGVGVVSCLYLGRGDAGTWSRIGAAAISYGMMPSMALALRFGLSQPCMGSTIAMRRETLDAIGGFDRFVDVLADDYAIGRAVSELGLRVDVPAMLVTHACEEPDFGSLWRHHLRWAATLRGIVGVAHLGTVITHALALSLLVVPFLPLPGLALVALSLCSRFVVKRRIDRQAGHATTSFGLLAMGDCFAFLVFLASLTARTVDWRGHRLTMERNGLIRPRADSRPVPAGEQPSRAFFRKPTFLNLPFRKLRVR